MGTIIIPILWVMKRRHLHKGIQLIHAEPGHQTKAVCGSRAVFMVSQTAQAIPCMILERILNFSEPQLPYF